jgi:L-methionine (R)-S-oxide reductase
MPASFLGEELSMDLNAIKAEIDEIARTSQTSQELQERICKKLNERQSKYNWVGFYMVDEHDPDFLVLDQFKGANTPHKRIRIGDGICGAAAESGLTIIVPDVNKDPRYLCCSIETMSEIVVPIFGPSRLLVGELDIDSHTLAAFEPEDQELIEYCAKTLGDFLEK